MDRKRTLHAIFSLLLVLIMAFQPVLTFAETFLDGVHKDDALKDTTSLTAQFTTDVSAGSWKSRYYFGIKKIDYDYTELAGVCEFISTKAMELMVCSPVVNGEATLLGLYRNETTNTTKTAKVPIKLYTLKGNANTVERSVFSAVSELHIPLEVDGSLSSDVITTAFDCRLVFFPKKHANYNVGYLAYVVDGTNYYLCIDRNDGNKVKITKSAKTEWTISYTYPKAGSEAESYDLMGLTIKANKSVGGKDTYLTADENGFKISFDDTAKLYFIDTVSSSESDQKYVVVKDGSKTSVVSAYSTASLKECINPETESTFCKWVLGYSDKSYYSFEEKNAVMVDSFYVTQGDASTAKSYIKAFSKYQYLSETEWASYYEEWDGRQQRMAVHGSVVRGWKPGEVAVVSALHSYKVNYLINGNEFEIIDGATYGSFYSGEYTNDYQPFMNGDRLCQGNWIALYMPSVTDTGKNCTISNVKITDNDGKEVKVNYSIENDGRTLLIKSMPACDINIAFDADFEPCPLDPKVGAYHTYFWLDNVLDGPYNGNYVYYTNQKYNGHVLTVNADAVVGLHLDTDDEKDTFFHMPGRTVYDNSHDAELYNFEVQWYYEVDGQVFPIKGCNSMDCKWENHSWIVDDLTVKVWARVKKSLKIGNTFVEYETEKYSLRFLKGISDVTGIRVNGVDTTNSRFVDDIFITSDDIYKYVEDKHYWGMDKVAHCYISYDGTYYGHQADSFENKEITTRVNNPYDDSMNFMEGQTLSDRSKCSGTYFPYTVTMNGKYTITLVDENGDKKFYYLTYTNIIENNDSAKSNFSVEDVNTTDSKDSDLVILKVLNDYSIADIGKVYAVGENLFGTTIVEGTLCKNIETNSDDSTTVYDGVYWTFNIENPGSYKIVIDDYFEKTDTALTFTVGEYNNISLKQTSSPWVSNGNGTHSHITVVQGVPVIETENCSGGTADCCHKAVCEVCQAEYGELDSDNHSNLVKVDWKAPRLQSDGCFEHWYCDGCGKYYKDKDGKEQVSKDSVAIVKFVCYPNGDGTHYYYTDELDGQGNLVKKTEDCSGGIATCVSKPSCELCGGEYGKVDADAHYSIIYFDKLEPTEDADGYEAHYSCEDCGTCFEDEDGNTKIEKPVINKLISAAKIELNLPADLTYNGKEQLANPGAAEGISGVGAITVHYYDEDGEEVTAPINVGKYTIKLDIEDGESYTGREGLTADTWVFEIEKRDLVVKADDKAKKVGEADPELTATVTGIVDDVTVNYSLTRASGESFGRYIIIVTSEDQFDNYNLILKNGSFYIETIELSQAEKIRNNIDGFLNGLGNHIADKAGEYASNIGAIAWDNIETIGGCVSSAANQVITNVNNVINEVDPTYVNELKSKFENIFE